MSHVELHSALKRDPTPAMYRADRAQLNQLEQMGPFLAGLWLHAWLVGPTTAAWLGGAYVLTRSGYWALYPRASLLVLFVTGPNYFLIATLLLSSLWAVL